MFERWGCFPWPLRALFLLVGLVWVWSIVDLYAQWGELHEVGAGWLVALRTIQVVLVGALLLAVDRGPGDTPLSAVMRVLLYAFLMSVAFTSLAEIWPGLAGRSLLQRSFFNTILVSLLACGLWMLGSPRRGRVLRLIDRAWLDVGLFNLAAIVLLVEIVLRAGAHYLPNPVLYETTQSRARIQAYRFRPGVEYMGFPVNAQGYYDEEFFVAAPGDSVIAMLADSFGAGIVPYEFNFATVAERKLRERLARDNGRVAIHNFGIPALDMVDYMYLLRTEVPNYNPALVVLCVFVGNDIHTAQVAPTRLWFTFQEWWIHDLIGHLIQFHEIWKSGNGTLAKLERQGREWIPDEDTPTFSEQRYLRIVRDRMQVMHTVDPEIEGRYREFFRILADIAMLAGDRLRVVVIPAEFQVNDVLFSEALAGAEHAEAYRRDYPQVRIASFCHANGLRCLDLLPALREAHGSRPVYRPRDTHWNIRGNRVAGEALAEFIYQSLPEAGIAGGD